MPLLKPFNNMLVLPFEPIRVTEGTEGTMVRVTVKIVTVRVTVRVVTVKVMTRITLRVTISVGMGRVVIRVTVSVDCGKGCDKGYCNKYSRQRRIDMLDLSFDPNRNPNPNPNHTLDLPFEPRPFKPLPVLLSRIMSKVVIRV